MPLDISDICYNRYFFPHIEVVANSLHKPNEEQFTSFTFHEELVRTEDHGRFLMELTITSNEEDSENPPYFFKVQSFGFFYAECDASDADEAEALAAIVGRRVLMGAVREQIVTLSSRGPWDPIYLRAITNIAPAQSVPNEPIEAEDTEPLSDD